MAEKNPFQKKIYFDSSMVPSFAVYNLVEDVWIVKDTVPQVQFVVKKKNLCPIEVL